VDANGNPATVGDDGIARDANGNPITDANGNPIVVNEGNVDPNLNGAGGSANTGGGAGNGNVGAAGAEMPVEDLPPQETPGGYFESGNWRGYAWTADDELNVGTTRSVQNFDELEEGEPFCLSGVVGPDPDYGGVALLGFNVAQAQFGATADAEPAIGTATPTGMGVAVNYTKTEGQALRIQLQGPNGETLASERWCADLTPPQGPAFIPYGSFRTECWEPVTDPATGQPNPNVGTAYNMSPLAAVVMTVPGSNLTPLPYNICISGFADGNGVGDAPDSISLPAGLLTGTMSEVAQKTKVIGRDGQEYVINNNAWGVNSRDGSQRLRYTANSFEILQQSAGPGGDSSPASFPSI
jgi:hypothetical protein